jgi:hypothetical protein
VAAGHVGRRVSRGLGSGVGLLEGVADAGGV